MGALGAEGRATQMSRIAIDAGRWDTRADDGFHHRRRGIPAGGPEQEREAGSGLWDEFRADPTGEDLEQADEEAAITLKRCSVRSSESKNASGGGV